MSTILGHHHVSMITKDAKMNNHFYTEIIGLRRVKKTVNQDDPSMYHLFYGDTIGSPGTELTFFEMPMAGQTHRGTNAITRIGLLVPSTESLQYWKERLTAYHVEHEEIGTYANRPAMHFTDKDGLELVFQVAETPTSYTWHPWYASTVPEEHQVRGIGTVELTVKRPRKLASTLTEMFPYEEKAETKEGITYQVVPQYSFSEILVREKDGDREKPGRGSTHHLAIRVRDTQDLQHWEDVVEERGFRSTGSIDRHYFHSLYFRESNGILFEIATDGPGFLVDTTEDRLGIDLDLPPFLEENREEIEENLSALEE